jgi:hypothetical protein
MRDELYANALSRRDNKTYICSICGLEEALIDSRMIPMTAEEMNFISTIMQKRLLKEGKNATKGNKETKGMEGRGAS